MNNEKFDRFFKIALLVIGFGFLAVYTATSGNGRYVADPKAEYICDTRTGILYDLGTEALNASNGGLLIIDPANKTLTLEPWKRHDKK